MTTVSIVVTAVGFSKARMGLHVTYDLLANTPQGAFPMAVGLEADIGSDPADIDPAVHALFQRIAVRMEESLGLRTAAEAADPDVLDPTPVTDVDQEL